MSGATDISGPAPCAGLNEAGSGAMNRIRYVVWIIEEKVVTTFVSEILKVRESKSIGVGE